MARSRWDDETKDRFLSLIRSGMSVRKAGLEVAGSESAGVGAWHRWAKWEYVQRYGELPDGSRVMPKAPPRPKRTRRSSATKPRKKKASKTTLCPAQDNALPQDAPRGIESLFALTDNACRYIIGDLAGEWGYCGREQKKGSNYCESHHAIVYATPERSGGEEESQAHP